MPIESFECPKHGHTTAYVYKIKSGTAKGWMRRTCRDCRSETVKLQWQRIKAKTIAAYGSACSCCGEAEPRFLTIDHIHGDGAKHRKGGVRTGWRLYEWLAKRGFPKDRYRLLCFNCNCARGQFGKCPHEEATS